MDLPQGLRKKVRLVSVVVGSALALGTTWLTVRSREARAPAAARASTVGESPARHALASTPGHELQAHRSTPQAASAAKHIARPMYGTDFGVHVEVGGSAREQNNVRVNGDAEAEELEVEVEDLPEPHHPELQRWAKGQRDERASATLHAHLDERIDDIGLSGELREVSCRAGLCRLRMHMRNLAEARELDDELGGPGHRRWMRLSPGQRGVEIDVVVDAFAPTSPLASARDNLPRAQASGPARP